MRQIVATPKMKARQRLRPSVACNVALRCVRRLQYPVLGIQILAEDPMRTAFPAPMNEHIDFILVGERLDVVTLLQAEAIDSAYSLLRKLLPHHQSVATSDPETFNTVKPTMTVEAFTSTQHDTETVRAIYNTTAQNVRNKARDIVPDRSSGTSSFEHQGPPNCCASDQLRDFDESYDPEDPVKWFDEAHEYAGVGIELGREDDDFKM